MKKRNNEEKSASYRTGRSKGVGTSPGCGRLPGDRARRQGIGGDSYRNCIITFLMTSYYVFSWKIS